MQNILSAAGFVPDSLETYQTSDVVKAVTDYVGAVPELTCKSGQVLEIRICFYKDFTVWNAFSSVDCGLQEDLELQSSC